MAESIIDDNLRQSWSRANVAHPCVELAFDGVLEYCEFDLSFCDVGICNQVFVACLDAMPLGYEEAKHCAARRFEQLKTW